MVGLNGAEVDLQVVRRMSGVLRHRGPDDDGSYISRAVGFGFRRLSILDLSPAGHQPMVSDDGQVVLVFNGEIYNYVELRDDLQSLGHKFNSRGDSEVLLHAYLQWGPACLDKLNGMWAFLIYDARQRKIFGSRDRFGKKPLYQYRRGDYVFFGSEIKAILASGFYDGGPNWNPISRLLIQSDLESEKGKGTFYLGIEQFPPGSAFELDLRGNVNEWTFWSLSDLTKSMTNDPEELFYATFEDAMRLRLRSDVPIGILLSGGMDSTSIACTLARINNGNMDNSNPTFAFSFQAKEYDESLYINDTVEQTGVTLIQFSPEPLRLWELLEQTLWYQDEPIHSMSTVITFELCRLAAANGVKVVLNGGGPDEFLAGYSHFFINYWCTLLMAGQLRELRREMLAYRIAHGGNLGMFFLECLHSHFTSKARYFAAYRRLGHWKRLLQLRQNSWFAPELFDYLPLNEERTDPDLDTALKRAVERHPLPLYLRTQDRNSMAHSIEQRMPFLDYRLVSLAFQLPANWKMRGPWNKYVLRQAMRGRIPESVQGRLDKMGFPVPTKSWFAGRLYSSIQDMLSGQKIRERGIYNLDVIRRDLELHREGKIDISAKLFNLVQFELWSKLSTPDARRSQAVPEL